MNRRQASSNAPPHAKKALKKGDYLQGSNANSLVRFGPAQGGEAGGEFIT